jgi:hypothetical protein
MSSKSISSLKTIKYDKFNDSIPCRIDFIKKILEDKTLSPMINFDNTKTDDFLEGINNSDESGDSYDTRVVLKKKFFSFNKIISQIGGTLKYIKSGTTGHTFKGIVGNDTTDEKNKFEYALKVVAYPRKDKYGDINDTRRPENAELMMIKLLSYFIVKKQTPHIVLPIGTFNTSISTFIKILEDDKIDDDKKEKYEQFVKRYKNNEYHDNVSILISEWANRGDFLDFVRNYYKYFKLKHWKTFFFQIISVLAIIQSKYPAFRHNDMKANNILVQKITEEPKYFKYKVVGQSYKVPNIGYQIKLWDFDFACIPKILPNKKVDLCAKWTMDINIKPVENKYYDIHYFFNTLIRRGFCPEVMTSSSVPDEVKEFIKRIIPNKYRKPDTKYVHKKGRILVDDEFTTPDEILKNDIFFDEFRGETNDKVKRNTNDKVKRNTNDKVKRNTNDDNTKKYKIKHDINYLKNKDGMKDELINDIYISDLLKTKTNNFQRKMSLSS